MIPLYVACPDCTQLLQRKVDGHVTTLDQLKEQSSSLYELESLVAKTNNVSKMVSQVTVRQVLASEIILYYNLFLSLAYKGRKNLLNRYIERSRGLVQLVHINVQRTEPLVPVVCSD